MLARYPESQSARPMTPADYKAARDRLGLTQEQLAKRVGVSVRTIASREAGGPITREAEIAIRAILSDHEKAPA